QNLVITHPVGLFELRARPGLLVLDEAGVRHLAAACRVEGGLAQLREELAVAQVLERSDLGEHLGLLVADEFGLEAGARGELGRPRFLAARAGPRPLALLRHQARERLLVDRDPTLQRELSGQLEREAVRVVETERVLAGDRVAGGDLLEQPEAALQGLREALLLGAHDLLDLAAVGLDLRVPRPHLLDDDVGDPPEVVEADRPPLLHGAPNDAAPDIPTALVRRYA